MQRQRLLFQSDGIHAGEGAKVVPLHISGAVDTDMTNMSSSEVMVWGVNNLWKEGKEGAYAVRHGQNFTSDFGASQARDKHAHRQNKCNQPNFFKKAYPCLFPYGVGGLEADRETQLDFCEHVQRSMQYSDP